MICQASAGVDLILAFLEHVYGVEETKLLVDAMEHKRMGICDDPYAELFGVPPTWTCVDGTPEE
jgi:hypothetical protein